MGGRVSRGFKVEEGNGFARMMQEGFLADGEEKKKKRGSRKLSQIRTQMNADFYLMIS